MRGWPSSQHAGSADNSEIRSRRLIAIASNKLAKAAARKQQRLLAIVSVGFDRSQEDDVIAAVISVGGTALETGDAVAKTGALPSPGVQFTPANLSPEEFANCDASACCEAPESMNEVAGILKDRQAFAKRPRLHSTSGGFSDTESKVLQVSPSGVPSAAIAVTMVTPVANAPSALRKSRGSIAELSLASSFAGSARMFWVRQTSTNLRASDFRTAGQALHVHNWFLPHQN